MDRIALWYFQATFDENPERAEGIFIVNLQVGTELLRETQPE